MAWWGWLIGAILALLLVNFYKLYWRALSDSRQLVNFLVLVLLKDDVREKQRANLVAFIANSNANGAAEIGTAVNLALTDLAVRMKDNTLGVAGILWEVKKQQAANK